MASKKKASPSKQPTAATKKPVAQKTAPAKQKPASKPAPSKKNRAAKPTAPSTKRTAAPKPAPAKKTAPAKEPAPKGAATSSDVASSIARILAWLTANAPAAIRDLGGPARASDIAAVEKALGSPLPADLLTLWRLHDGGLSIFEYEGFGPERALERRQGLEALRKKGTFDRHEIFDPSSKRTKPVKWHQGWLPIAQDGGGNLYCIDLAPGPAGVVGQVIRWENRGGPGAGDSLTLGRVLARYAEVLPQFVYDESSGTFDGPWIDLLAKK